MRFERCEVSPCLTQSRTGDFERVDFKVEQTGDRGWVEVWGEAVLGHWDEYPGFPAVRQSSRSVHVVMRLPPM